MLYVFVSLSAILFYIYTGRLRFISVHTNSSITTYAKAVKMQSNQSRNNSLISLIEVSEREAENGRSKNIQNNIKLKNIRRVVRNWRKCLACNKRGNLHRPSKEMRLYFCRLKRIYIQENDRVCNYHLQRQNWNVICPKTDSKFCGKIVDEMVSLLLSPPVNGIEHSVEIGLTNAQFNQIIRELGLPRSPDKHQQRIILAVKLYLERLRNGFTYKQMALYHKMNRKTISRKVNFGRNILLNNFVPIHYGYKKSREWLTAHTSDLARVLYCGNDPKKCVVILDGTYIYTCSTSNYAHQRQIYSGQKRRHLFKIMKVTSVDGSIIGTFGPFPATKNDAEILKVIFEKTSIEKIFRAGDVVLVDRGFRDCVNFLKSKHLNVQIPQFIKKGQGGQLNTKQGNLSRLVTKLRYAIETANGRMKNKWHIFKKIIPSILTIHLMNDYKIGAAILNAFGKPILCNISDFPNIGARMLSLVEVKNKLKTIIASKKFQRIKRLFIESIDPRELNFPRLNEQQIKNICLGNYAVRQAISYAADHIKTNERFKISTLPEEHVQAVFGKICVDEKLEKPMFITTEIKSRFRGQKSHNVYVLYDFKNIENKIFHTCDCQHGHRTLGCCAHIATIVWYFGLGRHQNFNDPAAHLNNFFNV